MDAPCCGREGEWLLLGLWLLASAGCRSEAPRGDVAGTVHCGGKPLPNVLVTFLPDDKTRGPRSSAMTDGQGRYRLRGEDQRDGAPVGQHRVIVEDMAVYSAPRDRDGSLLRKPPARFRARCSDPLQTPLRKEVQAGVQTIDLEVPSGL